MRLLLIITLISISFSAVAQNAKKPTNALDARAAQLSPSKLITYKTIDDIELKLHVFEPRNKSAKPTEAKNSGVPAFVFIHGGGWQNGSPTRFYPTCDTFAKLGMVSISVQYRLGSTHKTTPFECVKDGRSAIRYIRKHAKQLGIDPNRIAVAGASAGGHIAASTATLNHINESTDDTSISATPNALLLIFPVLDTTPAGYGYSRLKGKAASLSPLLHVTPNLPPTFITHGTGDTTVPHQGSVDFQKAMLAAGNRCELITYPDRPHGYILKSLAPDSDYQHTLNAMQTFLQSLNYIQSN